MIKKKFISVIVFFLLFTTVVPTSFAEGNSVEETINLISENQISDEVEEVTKENLIKKVKELFPDQFSSVNEQNFIYEGYNSSGDGAKTYDLSYEEEADQFTGSYVRSNFSFYGDELILTSFYFRGDKDKENALFPPAITQDEGLGIAKEFLNQFIDLNDYEVKLSEYRSYSQRPLTEPVQYEYEFYKVKNGLRISDQQGRITVLGNGEIISYYYHNYAISLEEHTFDAVDGILSEVDIQTQLENDLNVELQYITEWNKGIDEAEITLAYMIQPELNMMKANDGTYFVKGEFVEYKPVSEYQVISDAVQIPTSSFNKENIEDYSLQIISQVLDIEQTEISIENVNERRRQEDLSYSITFKINENYGDITFNGINGDVTDLYLYSFNRPSDTTDDAELSLEVARERAIEYLQLFSPAASEGLAWKEDSYNQYDERDDYYNFEFTRLINGIPYTGDYIYVRISKEDKLLSYSVNIDTNLEFPDADPIINKEEAISVYLEEMSTDLYYFRQDNFWYGYYEENEQDDHYKLVYGIDYGPGYLDAMTGERVLRSYESDSIETPNITVDHPWASAELNYMIQSGIITKDTFEQVKTDEPLNVEEGLNILLKSLYYNDIIVGYADSLEGSQSFKNVSDSAASYEIVEAAAQRGIINTELEIFDLEEPLTRERLAYWYVRFLGLQVMAEQEDLYSTSFTDVDQISEEYTGHVAIANALGIITKDDHGTIRPKEPVTLAQLAVSIGKLVNVMNQMDKIRTFY
ncbi:YcdB/YcdC domain-containing protein [Chengkuizengella axinellae]|uniref:S-layer homology domain-containing protein n=1 Tax=Chengkuizengella axinellae TaxID=3064388 RepID=A0ABT9J1F4_9BACL|nr:YcdB/YcdC domain-containing protein [Chengkuizengella sp. 2205SS18-9]MDP5275437.1 S-layer homology domain-containing protein [Chengkuizengella sp. 2205SS18-9]